jgi:hypothetical protein
MQNTHTTEQSFTALNCRMLLGRGKLNAYLAQIMGGNDKVEARQRHGPDGMSKRRKVAAPLSQPYPTLLFRTETSPLSIHSYEIFTTVTA